MNELMIKVEGFEKNYGTVRAVKSLDLEVAKGESFALLGPNGGGKTTLIRSVVGLSAPTKGRITVDGLEAFKEAHRLQERISYVPQRVGMPDLLRVDEVCDAFARLNSIPPEKVDRTISRFGLGPFRNRRAGELSGGLLQRLGLAVACMKDAQLMAFDEPTTNLDPPGREMLIDFLQELKQGGRTILFSSHMLHSAVQLADRVAVLVDGQMVSVQTSLTFRAAVTERTAVRLVLDRLVTANGILRAAEEAGAEITDCQDSQICFRAFPEQRLDVIRAIEKAGGTIEEFHTEVPDWESLIHGQLGDAAEDQS